MPKTLDEVDLRVNEYADVLKNIEVDWNLRMQAFKHFQKLLQEGEKMEGFLPLVASKKNIVAALVAQVFRLTRKLTGKKTEDRRSQIVKDACAAITTFASTIKKDFAHYADDLFVVLSKLLIVTIKGNRLHELLTMKLFLTLHITAFFLSFLTQQTCFPIFMQTSLQLIQYVFHMLFLILFRHKEANLLNISKLF